MDNLYNEETHGSLHQLGDRLKKSLRAVGARSGEDRVDCTDIRAMLVQCIYLKLISFL